MGKRIKQNTWNSITLVIRRYPERKKELQEVLEDIIYTKGEDSGKTNFDTEYSKPQSVTESKAIKLQSGYYKKLKHEIDSVERIYNSLSASERIIMSKRYWSDPAKVVKYLDIECGYSERQMKRIVADKIIYPLGILLGEIRREK